ncbi:MAG: Sulfatase [Verrucomicrobiales bacterium]|nr:Sulfatase [Verrucomicrobiales bacterium]
MFLQNDINKVLTRRAFLRRSTTSLGAVALGSLLNQELFGAAPAAPSLVSKGIINPLHFAPRAKRVIYLFMSGAPSHIDLFDPKPKLKELTGTELPKSVRGDQRITGMTSGQKQLLVVGSPYEFKSYGNCGAQLSELLPNIGGIADDITIIRSMYTDPINHDPAVTFFATGNQQPGRPTMGSWVTYGLGSENENLPGYVVLLSGSGGQPLQARYWGNGFLPGNYQGVQFRSQGDPVLYVSNPSGMSQKARRQLIDRMQDLNRIQLGNLGDPEIATHIENYELAFRMQTSVPELMDISKESKSVLDMYGAEPGKSSFANNCLLARRLAEKGVRFIQLCHRDWDHHQNLPKEIQKQAKLTDQASAALIKDLKTRGLLEDTLVIWGGEFGRTTYSQGEIKKDSFGRDHHPRCFSLWMAGGGIKRGLTIGQTDDFGYNLLEDPVHVHDLHATMLHCLGINHEKLTYRSEGRNYRLTDVAGEVVKKILI